MKNLRTVIVAGLLLAFLAGVGALYRHVLLDRSVDSVPREPATSFDTTDGIKDTAGVASLLLLDDTTLVSASTNDDETGDITFWDLTSNRRIARIPTKSTISSLALCNGYVLVGQGDGKIGKIDVANLKYSVAIDLCDPILAARGPGIRSITVNGTNVAVCQNDGRVSLWNTTSNESRVIAKFARYADRALFLSDHELLLLGLDEMSALRTYDLTSNETRLLHTFKRGRPVQDMDVHVPSNRLVVSGYHLIECFSLKPFEDLFWISGGGCDIVRISPSGARLFAGGLDLNNTPGWISVWDMQTGQKLDEFRSHVGGVMALEVFRKKRGFVSGGTDGMINIWNEPG